MIILHNKMKSACITSILTLIMLLVFEVAFSLEDHNFQSRNKGTDKTNWFKPSEFSNELDSFSTRRKRQVEVRMNGIQDIYENPQSSYNYQNLGNNQGQLEYGGSTLRDVSGNVAAANSVNIAPMLFQSPEGNVEQAASRSFDRSGLNKWSQKNKYASTPQSSQTGETDYQKFPRDDQHLPKSFPLYNKEDVLNPQTDEADRQRYSPNPPVTSNIPYEDKSLMSPAQADVANMQNNLEEHFSSDSTLSNSAGYDSSMSSSQQQKTIIHGIPQAHPFPIPQTLPSHIVEPNAVAPLPVNPHIYDITAHSFMHASPIGDPNLDLLNPHIGPIIHSDAPPQVINPLGPDNIHIIKKFYPLPVVQKVPKPVPVIVTKPVPYPVHKTRFQHVPQPYPQPFSKPDVHLSHIHLENRVNPCKHGGIMVQGPGGYTCLCRKAYKGKHCQERDKCYPYPCENNGDCIDHGTHYECRCPRGFKGINCEVADKCHNHPCKNDAKCLQMQSNIKCICPSGFKGKYCEVIDHCHPNPCRHGGKCVELNQAATCLCTAKYKGQRCQVPKTCSLNLCRNGATCLEDRPSSPCLCASGFSGRYCTEDVCLPNPCQHNGKCYPRRSELNGTWYAGCKCSNTFKGELCRVPNPCASNPSPCVHGVCYDAYTNIGQIEIPQEGYTCHCYEGYFGINCQYRKCDHCDVNARCLDGFKCSCNEGYQGDGQDCRKIPDPCFPNPCQNEGLCKAELNTFECNCLPGFNGKTCLEKTPCGNVVSRCKNGGTCLEEKDDFRCICTREWKGKDCSENATSLCIGARCLNGGTCRVSEDGKSWYCMCRGPRFKPPDCACNCPANAHLRFERNLTCNNPEGVCECMRGYEHHKGREVCIDQNSKKIIHKSEQGCVPDPCKNGGKCVSLSYSKWMCQCTKGWSGKICDIAARMEKNSSCDPNPCENGGICSVVSGAAVCACSEGYLPPLCEIRGRTTCSPNPCKNAGRCVPAGKGYDCICDQRFTGPNCEVDRCQKCDPVNAVCNLGQCSCKPGFLGNGYQCLGEETVTSKKVYVCAMCHPIDAVCVDNSCQCKPGYVGNGYQCTTSHPGTVQYVNPSNNQQIPWFKRNGIL